MSYLNWSLSIFYNSTFVHVSLICICQGLCDFEDINIIFVSYLRKQYFNLDKFGIIRELKLFTYLIDNANISYFQKDICDSDKLYTCTIHILKYEGKCLRRTSACCIVHHVRVRSFNSCRFFNRIKNTLVIMALMM